MKQSGMIKWERLNDGTWLITTVDGRAYWIVRNRARVAYWVHRLSP